MRARGAGARRRRHCRSRGSPRVCGGAWLASALTRRRGAWDAHSSGDLFDALFKPHSGGRLARPRAMPEPIALHYSWQLVQAVSCLHAQHHFHRDLKARAVGRAWGAGAGVGTWRHAE
jgi:hypothetical protein